MGRPRKDGTPARNPVKPQVTGFDQEAVKVKKYPMNPDPDIIKIRGLVQDALGRIGKKDDGGDVFGASYQVKLGYCEHVLKLIAEELGVEA